MCHTLGGNGAAEQELADNAAPAFPITIYRSLVEPISATTGLRPVLPLGGPRPRRTGQWRADPSSGRCLQRRSTRLIPPSRGAPTMANRSTASPAYRSPLGVAPAQGDAASTTPPFHGLLRRPPLSWRTAEYSASSRDEVPTTRPCPCERVLVFTLTPVSPNRYTRKA